MISAEPARLKEINGIGETAVIVLKTVQASARRLTEGEVGDPPTIGSWDALIDYCRSVMVFETREQFRVLNLDRKNGLIADEIQGRGTVDHTSVYAREVVKRALEVAASAVILVHNHAITPWKTEKHGIISNSYRTIGVAHLVVGTS